MAFHEGVLKRCASGALTLASLTLGCQSTDPDVAPVPEEGELLPRAETSELARERPIVFSRGPLEGVGDLYLMGFDGAEPLRITEGGDYYISRWSKDGRSIAYRRQIDGDLTEVGLVSADGREAVPLTGKESAILYIYPPNWSNDGALLSYASMGDASTRSWSSMRMWVTTPSGSMQRPLLPNIDVTQTEAIWSPDGSRVAYVDMIDAHNNQVWLAGPNGSSEPESLTQDRIYGSSMMRWSPDGRFIAFVAFPVDAEGMLEGGGGHAAGSMPPDQEIYLVEVETKELTRITDNAANDYHPTWSPDGQSLLITSDRDGDDDLWLVPLAQPDAASNLIDDNANPQFDTFADWYAGDP